MNILSLLTGHTHYWGIPHERDSDGRLIQTCYECGAEREIKIDLHPTFRAETLRPKKDRIKAA